jgi:hypothetical protein
MPGVNRPYTLVDVLGTLNQQSQPASDLLDGFGDFAETAEQGTLADSAVLTHSAPPGYDQATWGTAIWT